MRAMVQSLIAWGEDRLFRRVLRNSSYLFASNAIGALMSILTARLLGVAGFGELGIIIAFVSNVNRLLSFRMSDVVVRYMGEYMARKEVDRAAALVKAAGLTEAATSLLAYVVLMLLAPLGARYIVKDPAATPLFLLYGVSILANITTETATGVLQVGNHFRSQALINLVQACLVTGVITAAYVMHGGLAMILWAYLIGKIVLGIGPIVVAIYRLRGMLGPRWWQASFDLLPPRRELVHFALSTNFSGTINMIVRDSEVLWVGYFFTSLQAGYYKAALMIINLIVMPITPFVNTTYPEINHVIVTRQWGKLRKLLKQVTLVAGAWTGVVALGLVLIGKQAIFLPWSFFGQPLVLFGRAFSPLKASYLPAYPALMILLVGFGIANVLFWNRPLLLSLGLPGFPLKVALWATVAKVALTFLIVPTYGYIAEAILLTAYFAVTVGLNVWKGMGEVRRVRALELVGVTV
ncbi:MAG: oligosaccharide flippase family protein [Chloroflexi bacterium]|nr:oligosaccharide flippase family protein [Chloroflexota bacterium]